MLSKVKVNGENSAAECDSCGFFGQKTGSDIAEFNYFAFFLDFPLAIQN